jgi:hypothetical protein
MYPIKNDHHTPSPDMTFKLIAAHITQMGSPGFVNAH